MAGNICAEQVNLISAITTEPKMLYVESGDPKPEPNCSITGDGYIKKIAISDLVYTRDEVDTKLAGKSNVGHQHAITDITNLQTALNNKADKVSITGATKTKITYNSQGIITAGADLAASDLPSHTHSASQITGLAVGTKVYYNVLGNIQGATSSTTTTCRVGEVIITYIINSTGDSITIGKSDNSERYVYYASTASEGGSPAGTNTANRIILNGIRVSVSQGTSSSGSNNNSTATRNNLFCIAMRVY